MADTANEAGIPEEPCPKEKLTAKEWVLCRIQEEGFSPVTANKVIQCESGWNNQATHTNTNGSTDSGLWQINSIHTSLSEAEKKDIYKSTEFAIVLLKSNRSWNHWVCNR